MSDLTGQEIKETYKDLLHMNNGNTGVTSDLSRVFDGEGTGSSLYLSDTEASVMGHLQVKGPNDTTFDNLSNVSSIGTNAYDSGNAGGGIQFGGKYDSDENVTTFAQISGIKENATNGDYKAALTFGTRDGSSVNMERMRIDSAGRCGIGTTSPSAKLHIKDNSSITSITSANDRSITIQDTSEVNNALSLLNFTTSNNYSSALIGARATTNVAVSQV